MDSNDRVCNRLENTKKVLKTAGFMVAATLLAKVLGMLRDVLVASNYGTQVSAVAFYTASRIPMLLFDFVIGGVISSTFIPVFNEYLEKKGKEQAMRFANQYINVVLLITVVITILGLIFSSTLIHLIAPDISDATKVISRGLSNIMFPMIIFTGLAYSFVGILQSFGEFNIPSIISLVSNGVIILYFLIFQDKFGVTGLAVAMLIGWGLQAVIQVPWLKKFGYSYRPYLSFRDEGIRKAGRLALPMLVSTWAQPLCSLINMRLASSVNEGAGIAAMEYANKIYIIVTGVFSFVVTNLIFPYLSRASAADRQNDIKSLMVTSLKALSFIILPIMFAFFILAKPIISLMYERGEFVASDVAMTSTALMFYSIGMLALAFCELLNKSFFSMHDSKTPMYTSIFSISVNIVLSIVLSRVMGIGGLALATAIASIVNAISLFVLMSKRQNGIFDRKNTIDLLKTVICTVLMGVVVFVIYWQFGAALSALPLGKIVVLAVPLLAGGIVYLLAALVLRLSMANLLVNTFLKRKGD